MITAEFILRPICVGRAKFRALPRLPNQRAKHWAVAARENKRWRLAAYWLTREAGLGGAGLTGRRFVVRMTRVRSHGPDADTDGLVASFKAIRDGIADALWAGCTAHVAPCGPLHDGTRAVQWECLQVRESAPRVRVSIDVVQPEQERTP